MTRRSLILLSGLGSAALLLAAFGFQHIGGLAPCAMCLWQRWPHAAAIAIAAVGAAVPAAAIAVLGGLSMVVNAGIALFHTGVERDWWEGPQSCTGAAGQDLGAMSASDLLATDTGPRIVLCDEVAWEMLGLSMASWNGLASVALAMIWFAAAMRRRTAG
ncbi:disulfide bond formation protein B [Rhodophyticola porphyridii]|uniref:Disulfide bond formation protein B n=1 Tax=Rhodophyticola porphyridii TaxID=1852017 RepID=A0A3L9Y0S1_9RHOB|nr:disulfide bond formation protein B [Rhodophyticola porphyridii]RMA42434.1 disulfide bond formation protein B [Rhodophyticola porphyridii]